MVTRPGRAAAASVVTASLALIGFMTLRPAEAPAGLPTFCIFCGPLGGVDFTLNMALFVPLGLGLRWLTGRWTTSVVLGAATTLGIEALQWRLIPGRDASLGDLIANTLGTMLGAWLAVEAIRWLNATSAFARRLSAAFGILTAGALAASAWLLQPVSPTWAQYVQWMPERSNTDPFGGQLTAVELNGRPMRPFEILPSQWTFNAATRSVSIRATVGAPVPPSRRQSIIVRIANDREEGFFFGQWGKAATFRTHLAAVRMRLRPILVGLDDGFSMARTNSETGADELTITAVSNPRAITVSRERGEIRATVTLRRTVGLAWALLLPWDVALDPAWWWANALWLGALTLPVSFFTLRAGNAEPGDSRHRFAWWPFSLVLAAMVVAPAATGLSSPGVGEWIGIVAGIATGWAVERWTAPDQPVLKADVRPGTIPS